MTVNAEHEAAHSAAPFGSLRAGRSRDGRRWAVALLLALALEGGLAAAVLLLGRREDAKAPPPPPAKRTLISVALRSRGAAVVGRGGEQALAPALPPRELRTVVRPAVARTASDTPAVVAPIRLEVASAVMAEPEVAGAEEVVEGGAPGGLGDATSGGQRGEAGGGCGALGQCGPEGGAIAPPPVDLVAYGKLVSARLALHKRYPVQARRMRLQGTAYLELRLGPSGHLDAVRLLRSSGHPVLDEEALRLTSAANPFPPPPGSGGTTFTVPIQFGGG